MTLSVAGIEGRKIGGPLGARQPERLADGPLGERGDPRGVEHATFAVQRMQAHEPFDLAGYDRHARPGGLSAPHDLARRLADERRLVERPLAGDHWLRIGEAGIESHSGQNPLRSARELGLGEIREPRAQSARGTAPGEHRQVSPAVPGHQLREALESPGKELHTFGPRSLLWPEHRRGALWADQRRGHVGERNDARGEAPSPLKLRQLGQRPASFGKRLAVGVEERPAESASRAGPAVYRGGPTQTHDYRLGAPFDRLPDWLPDSTRRGPQRVELVGREKRDPAGGGTLENRRLRIHPAELTRHRRTQGAGHRDPFTQRPTREDRVQEPIAPIRDGELKDRRVR